MKRMSLCLLLGAALAPRLVVAKAPPSNTITVKVGEHLALEYERAVRDTISLFIGPALFAGSVRDDIAASSELGVGASLGARFFLTGAAPAGLFASPVFHVGYTYVRQGPYHSSAARLSSGAMLGYTWIFNDVVVL